MEIRDAKYLLEIEKTKHLTKAANNLFLTQPALSRVLKKLEAEFNGPIFMREGSALVPTEIGRIVLRKSANIVREYQEMKQELEGLTRQEKKVIRVGLPLNSGFMLSAMIMDFQEDRPDISLNLEEAAGNVMLEMIEKGDLDVIFPIRPIESGNLNENLLFSSEIAVGVTERHTWYDRDYVTDMDFDGMEIITAGEQWQIYHQIVNRFRKANVQPVFKMLGKEMSWMMEYARRNNVPIILPAPSLLYYGWDDIHLCRFMPAFTWETCMAYSKRRAVSRPLQEFITYVLGYFSNPEYKPSVTRGGREIDLSKVMRF